MEKQKIEPYRETFKIRSYEVDTMAQATFANVANYMQEVAGNHAYDLGLSVDTLIKENLTWIVSRIKIEMDRYPNWREKIVTETWPSGYSNLAATRDFLMFDLEENVIGKATSLWMAIDLKTRRPAPIKPIVGHLVPPEEKPRAMEVGRIQPDFEDIDNLGSAAIVVRKSDCDMNSHANNVRYIDWALESIPMEWEKKKKRCRTLDIQFKAEVFAGDQLLAQTISTREEKVMKHTLVRTSDSVEVCSVVTYW